MLDKGEPDDKILAVPREDPAHGEYFDIADIPQHTLREIEHFFAIYKALEPGKESNTGGLAGREAAWQEIREARANFIPHH